MAVEDKAPWWLGAVFIAAGAAIMGVGVGWIEVDPASVHAPPWVLTACGGVFVLGGLSLFAGRFSERLNHVLALLMVGLFATIATWIAFGPGERAFSGTASLGPVAIGGLDGETVGRAVFGLGAVLLWMLVILIAGKLIRSIRSFEG